MLNSREASPEENQITGLIHRVYCPESTPAQEELGKKPPLVLMVHGRAGDNRVMWIFSKAFQGASLSIKPIVVAPQAPIKDQVGGFSWWEVHHPPDTESPLPSKTLASDLEQPLASLETFIDRAVELYGADRQRIFAIGFSQGAGCVGSLALRNPGKFSGVAMLSGFIPGVVKKELEAKAGLLGGARFFIAHGTKDVVIPFQRAEEDKKFLELAGAEVTFCQEEVGHKTGSAGIRALGKWFEELMSV